MSGKGNGKGGSGSNKAGGAKSGGASVGRQQEPTVVTGWEYHQYSQRSGGDRYQYIGKDEDTGEPEFLDYGPKGGR